MKASREVLAVKLQRELGTEAVTLKQRVLDSHSIDGKSPTILCLPSSPEQVSAALRICAEAQAAVVPWGGGTSMALGNIPRRLDIVIGLDKLSKLVEHDDANLTATVQAGMRLAAFQELLKQGNQFLPIDAPQPERATIGGLVAANVNGPRRMLYGGVRDLVVGMKMALATGEEIKAGGKVVKNVAGYDMCKLFVGSLGTLGIITEVTFKVAPLPESSGTVVAQGPLDDCMKLTQELSSTALLPAAVSVFNTPAATAQGFQKEMAAVVLRADGFKEAVERHLVEVRLLAERASVDSEVLPDESQGSLWKQICEFGIGEEGILYRLTVPLSSIRPLLTAFDQWSATKRPARIVAHSGSGTIWIQTNADSDGIEWFSKLTLLAQEHKGHAVLVAAPPALKEGIDVWGPAPPSLEMMRAIKREFDPHDILNPGRFLGGL